MNLQGKSISVWIYLADVINPDVPRICAVDFFSAYVNVQPASVSPAPTGQWFEIVAPLTGQYAASVVTLQVSCRPSLVDGVVPEPAQRMIIDDVVVR